jgi:PAS domain S-box-containing protein
VGVLNGAMRGEDAARQARGIGERPLALKLLALLVAVLATAGAVAIVAADRFERRASRDTRDAEAAQRADALAKAISVEWAHAERGAFPAALAKRLVETAEDGRRTWDVTLLRDGETSEEGLRTLPPSPREEVAESATVTIPPAAAASVRVPPRVRVRIDLAETLAGIDADLWQKALFALMGIVGATAGLYFGVERLVLGPIHRVHRALVRMAGGGPYEPVEPRGRDEIAALTAQVNRVVAALIEREAAQNAQRVALERSEALTRAISDTALDAMITTDERGTVLTANPAVERILGHAPAALVGTPVADLFPPRHADAIGRALGIAGSPPPPAPAAPAAFDALHEDGSEVPVEVAVGAAATPGGRVSTLVLRDLTHQRAVEAQLLQAQKMEAIGTLAGGIAHDFNNILSVIVGQADLARVRLGAESPATEALDAIVAAGQRGASLTSRLLGFARRSTTNVRATDVGEIVSGVRALLGRTFDRAVEIREDVPPALPPILADGAQVETALVNLCINARDAMPKGGVVTISAEARALPAGVPPLPEALPAGEYVRVSVADTGTGMTPEVRARLFEPFFTTKERGRGTGLGLPMVYAVVRGHGGFVEVDSAPGRGTRFDLWFPRARGAAESRAPVRPGDVPRGDETLLVIDDEEPVRTAIARMLETYGYRVLTAADGPSGLDALVRHPEIALVVLDMILPGIGGAETFRRLRAMRRDVRVLISTGYSSPDEASEILRQGGDGILRKPYLPHTIAGAVRTILDEHRPSK